MLCERKIAVIIQYNNVNTYLLILEVHVAQKVKSRSSSSEQLGSQGLVVKSCNSSRRFDALSRKIRKDSVIDRLRKEKMNKVFALNRKLSTGCDPHSKLQINYNYFINIITIR